MSNFFVKRIESRDEEVALQRVTMQAKNGIVSTIRRENMRMAVVDRPKI